MSQATTAELREGDEFFDKHEDRLLTITHVLNDRVKVERPDFETETLAISPDGIIESRRYQRYRLLE